MSRVGGIANSECSSEHLLGYVHSYYIIPSVVLNRPTFLWNEIFKIADVHLMDFATVCKSFVEWYVEKSAYK